LSALKVRALLIASLLISAGMSGPPVPQGNQEGRYKPVPGDVLRAGGFPSIGKWMISPRLTYSDWLGAMHEGKRLREPVNVIIVDPFARSEEDAVNRLLGACGRAGFTPRFGHSGGYFGWLGDQLRPQIPSGERHALSDEPFEFHNNHGRFFGPCFWAGRYYFVGAFSREKFVPATRAEHRFVSFNQARDRFAQRMMEKGGFELSNRMNLENALPENLDVCTGDHDGIAVVLTAVR
jgi:hypothetical protein